MRKLDLIGVIDAHLARTGETPTAFGIRVAGDSNLVADLRGGRSPRLRLVECILEAVRADDTTQEPERAQGLHAEATALGLDADAIAQKALREAISAEKARRWQEENREAIEAWNRWTEENPLPLAEYRMF